ncbi:MAG: response regulator transcription factor [Spirochaetales bacterium]|nr:response regulator transcription factor [Leptospiraceae bacterium]MCP5483223.1 response regulator transcription factor [Spirochaetales bacterium]MCP5486792.1 response regulator transcription factor [Spirochaetales bacterium]
MQKQTRVYLADDHRILREGVRHILSEISGCEVVGEAGDGRQALQEIEEIKPDVAVLDISMPNLTGIEISRQLRRYHPEIKIIILSRHDNEEYIEQLLKHGVDGYVLKDDAGDDLLRAVEAVVKGEKYLSPRIASKVVRDLQRPARTPAADSPFVLLTNREREILKLIAEGKTNEEIARALWISPRTAKAHRANIMKKLDVHKVTELVRYAIRSGLVEE